MDAIREGLRDRDRGAVKITTVLATLIVLSVLFVLVKIVPVYVEERQIIHEVEELARIASVRGYDDDRIAENIKRINGSFSLGNQSISLVSRDPGTVKLGLKYTRSVDLLVTTYQWKVEHTATGRSL